MSIFGDTVDDSSANVDSSSREVDNDDDDDDPVAVVVVVVVPEEEAVFVPPRVSLLTACRWLGASTGPCISLVCRG